MLRSHSSPPCTWGGSIRQLTLNDKPSVTEHFLRLDSAGLRGRFGRGISARDILGYVEQLPIERGVHAGCFEAGALRGLLEARPVNDRVGHWECVVSVEADWQRRGMGLGLTGLGLCHARKAGASRMYMRCCVTNLPGQAFLARHAAVLREDDGDAVILIDLTGVVPTRH